MYLYFIVFNNNGKAIAFHHFDEYGNRTWEVVAFPTHFAARTAAQHYLEARGVDWPFKVFCLDEVPGLTKSTKSDSI